MTALPPRVATPVASPMAVPAIFWGTSQDLAYNASSGASVRAGPFTASILRLALPGTAAVRVAIGDGTVAATAASTLVVGPGVEFVAVESGQYLAALSNDSGIGSLNITPALSL